MKCPSLSSVSFFNSFTRITTSGKESDKLIIHIFKIHCKKIRSIIAISFHSTQCTYGYSAVSAP